jgi:hypothetical protein
MANFTKTLADGASVVTVNTQIYAPPALTKGLIRQMTVCNPTTAVIALTVAVITHTGGTARTVISARNVAVNETYLCPEVLNAVIDVGGSLQLWSGAAGLTYVVSGVEMTQ